MLRVCVIGSGNVGFHLALAWHEKGVQVVQVFARELKKALQLAERIDAQAITQFQQLVSDADLYVLAVPDHAIEQVASKMKAVLPTSAFVVHTSGATPSTLLQPYFSNFGVFYPLQTFSIAKQPDFQQIPICIDASTSAQVQVLFLLAVSLSPKVFELSDTQRAKLHLAAVFANNFTNYCYHIAEMLLQEDHISFELLQPLIQETVNKMKQLPPAQVQTGPAIRGDVNTLQRHLHLLSAHPDWQLLYQHLSDRIRADLGTP